MTRFAAWRLLMALGICATAFDPAMAPSSAPREKENIKSKDGFGAQLWFVELNFVDAWLKGGTPHVRPIRVAQRGKPYVAAIIFAGAAADRNNNADVSYDIRILAPDGSIYGEQKDLSVWNRTVDRGMQLCEKYLTITIEPTDQAGRYTIDVLVRDNIRKVELPLKTSFEVERLQR